MTRAETQAPAEPHDEFSLTGHPNGMQQLQRRAAPNAVNRFMVRRRCDIGITGFFALR